MTMKRDHANEGSTATPAVQVDVLEILEQLGIDRANWPDDLPPLTQK
ncbi:hypothetical protein SAMN02799624_02484 [Paenibacillus sp. UNC496MF]|nr:hypothetical protein [Paenibacillus sp. UNC496MF]SFI88321.1 hypothetical protein SAMN02799624_02484 [Paenibacillus sp. UNC496MF]